MNKSLFIVFLVVIGVIAGVIFYNRFKSGTALKQNTQLQEKGLTEKPNPLSIEYMRLQEYPGSDIVIEQTLADGSNYKRYIASYKSEGLKIYALLTVPKADPSTGRSTLRDEPSGSDSKSSGSIADGNRIGMWGHSMGGMITLRSMVVSKDIKAVEIWHRSCCFTDKRNALLSYSGLFGELLRANFEIG